MRILVLAPHPFYQERGTPIAVDLLVRALSELGHSVDVLTLHEGEDREYPNMRIFRIAKPPGVSSLRPGPSFKKLACDCWLFARLIRLLRRERYDMIHAVEESAFMAIIVKPIFGIRYVYDMDSSLASQILAKYRWLAGLGTALRFLESLPIRRAEAVLPVCDALAELAGRYPTNRITVLRDISLLGSETEAAGMVHLREELGISGTVSAYIGNLERYQGIDLLLQSFAIVAEELSDAHLVIIGGEEQDIERYQAVARQLGFAHRVHFLGKKPVEHMAGYLRQANVLVSPRIHGENTPMKVYSYLHSGVPVLATNLPTHTQVITEEIACLASPAAKPFSAAWITLLGDDQARKHLGRQAMAFIEREHSYASFRKTLHDLYNWLEERATGKPSVHQHSASR